MLRCILFVILPVSFLIILFAQPSLQKFSDAHLPASLKRKLDSLKRSGNLTEWLYAYREYVSEDPVNRITELTDAQSNIWRECISDTERIEFLNCLATQGYYLMYGGNILHSIDAYEKAYQFYYEKPLKEIDVVEHILKPLGNNYTRLGDYERALFIHEKALSLAAGKNDSAAVYNNIAIVERSKGELDKSRRDVEKGLQVVAINTSLHGLLLATQADILLREGKFNEAGSVILESIDILKKNLQEEDGAAPYWLISAYRVYADVLAMKDELPAAIRTGGIAIDIIDKKYKGARKREKAQVLISLGGFFLKMQEPLKSMQKYDEALSIMLSSYNPGSNEIDPKDLYGEYSLLDALHGKADCLNALNDKVEALRYYMLFFIAQKKLRHEFSSTASKQLQQAEYRKVMESAIGTAYDLWKTSGKKEYADKILIIAEISKAQLLQDEIKSNLQFYLVKNRDTVLIKQQKLMQAIAFHEREAALNSSPGEDSNKRKAKMGLEYELTIVQKQLKGKYPDLASALTDTIPSVEILLQNLSPGMSVIEFFTGENSIFIIRASEGKVESIQKLENSLQVRNAVSAFMSKWFRNGPQMMINEPEKYYHDAYQVYHWLWKGNPVKEKWLVVPDGIIGYLPFEALVSRPGYNADIDQWPFVLKETNTYYTYSLQTWQQQRMVKSNDKDFAGFFISFDTASNSLPAVKKEYEEIRNAVKGDYFIDRGATLREFSDHLNEVNLLHVSTHSYLQGKGNIPVLQFADDKFFLFDLYGRFFQPQLVVLSACRTGNGILAEGEGVISLARGFTAAGAGGIIAGLWNMNDESTAKLMGAFYSQLVSDHSPANALRSTKMKWLKEQSLEIHKLPYFWAGLIYSGDNEDIFVEGRNSARWIGWLVAGAVILFLIFAVRTFSRKKK